MQQVFCLSEDDSLASFLLLALELTIIEVLAHTIRVVNRYPVAISSCLSFLISDIFITLLEGLLRFFDSAFDLRDFDFCLGCGDGLTTGLDHHLNFPPELLFPVF